MTHNPMSTMVDDQLGSAFKVVREVYDNLPGIKAVYDNLAAVRSAANNMRLGAIQVEGAGPAVLGASVSIALPSGLEEAAVTDFSVILTGTDEALYTESTGYFTAKLLAGFLVVSIDAEAPPVLAGSTVRWTISYTAN